MESREAISGILDGLKAKGIPVEAHREIIPSLEDVFIDSVERGEGQSLANSLKGSE